MLFDIHFDNFLYIDYQYENNLLQVLLYRVLIYSMESEFVFTGMHLGAYFTHG